MGFFINNFEQSFIYKRKMTRNMANIFSHPKSWSNSNIYSTGTNISLFIIKNYISDEMQWIIYSLISFI